MQKRTMLKELWHINPYIQTVTQTIVHVIMNDLECSDIPA
jgi:hypothetical protein